ncbi:type IV pilus assembly protein PilO [Neobacillus niacini]|uniref:pilus assembly protein PilO n=1 Tax=Neobacillus niacini TaxID=86668 RepID=UPI0028621FCC|nr:pilus assembly protein PilO [Neobacillus niacini]MDR7077921.1 type IV pilus assembly protein PilO [Neobacillus niacini]
MKLSFSKKHKLILLVGILLIVLLFVFAQFFKLSPLKSDLTSKEQTLASEQKLLESNTQEKLDETKKVTEDTRELQKKVPVTPLQEQFILDLEKAENVSNSKISSMSFSKDVDVTLPTEPPPATENTEGTETPKVETVKEATAEQVAPAPATGLKKLTVNLSIESPKYEDIEKFISTLESLKRIVVVESINYTGKEEITSLDSEKANEPLTYTLTVSAYYLPGLEDLMAELPKIDAPAPANKKNPLSAFSEVN